MASVGGEGGVVAGGDGPVVPEGTPDADGDGAGAQPVAGIGQRDAAGRHHPEVRHRREDALEERHPEHVRREDLADVGAGLGRGHDLGRREAAGHRGRAERVRRPDDLGLEDRADDVGRAGLDGPRRRLGVRHGADAEHDAVAERVGDAPDLAERVGHGHRDLDRGDAAGDERLDGVHEALRVL